MNRLQACRLLEPLVWGAVWAWWMLLGRDLHWMMRNEAGGRFLPPQTPRNEPRIWRFPLKTSKFGSIHVNIRAPFKRPLVPRSRRVQCRGVNCCIARLRGGSSLWTQVLGCPMCSHPSSYCALPSAVTSYRGSYRALTELSRGLSRGLSRDNLVIAGVIAWVVARVFLAPASKPSLISRQDL